MSTQNAFRSGQPTSFTATHTFNLGTTGHRVVKGDEILFDGSMVTIPGAPPILFPQLRAALKTNWIIASTQYQPGMSAGPAHAVMAMRPADGGNPMNPVQRRPVDTMSVEAEEREVRNVRTHAQETQQRNLVNYRNGGMVRSQRGFEVIEDQEGVAIRSNIKTAAVHRTNLEKTSPYTAIQQANNVQIDPGVGMSRDEMLDAMTDEERSDYELRRASRLANYDPEGAAQIVQRLSSPNSRTVEGIHMNSSVGGGVEIADVAGMASGPATVSVIEQEGMRFTTTNGPKRNVRLVSAAQPVAQPAQPAPTRQVSRQTPTTTGPGAEGMSRQIAKSICLDFPDNYHFEDPIRKKIARLQADYEDRPDVIRAVAAADTDPQVRERLLQEFPHAFGG